MAFGDRILVQARQNSIQLEGLAAMELREKLNEYIPPSYGARQMVESYANYAKSGGNSNADYLNFRSTFSETRSLSHQVFSKVIGAHVKPERYPVAKSMFQVDDADLTIRGAVRSLQHTGMWKARFSVPPAMIESLKAKSLARFEGLHGDMVGDMMTGKDGCKPQIKSSFSWVSTFEEMYEISGDPLLLSIVQSYLGVPPIFDTPVVFLNSAAPLDEKGLSDTAQLYHHDMHRLRFVKLFIYLTDVDAKSGPHAMIPGTHRQRPDAMWEDGRHTDEKLKAHGLLDKEVRITGAAGTVFLVDTSALHKGVHPEGNARLLAQVQYSNSLFGKPRPTTMRVVTEARTTKEDEDLQVAAALSKKYAEKVGVRFMQGMI